MGKTSHFFGSAEAECFYLRGMNEGKNPKGVGTNDGQSSSTSSSLLKEICWIQVGLAHFESNATYRYIFNMHLESDGPKELEGAFTSQSVS